MCIRRRERTDSEHEYANKTMPKCHMASLATKIVIFLREFNKIQSFRHS